MLKKDIPTNIDFEIINIVPKNEFISECEIKVFYHGKNRNGSYISKAVGTEIANSLPRAPIVAFYNEKIEDFEDHAEELIINRNGIKFIKKTIPYGAVDQLAPIVWKEYIDTDGIKREYLVCKGYLWTGRYPELNAVIENGKGQSMEFFPESVAGSWAIFPEVDREFFIIDEAKISALCILGDEVEPCFEGASVHAPEILYSLKKDEFKANFNTFMFELNKILEEGSANMENLENQIDVVDESVQTDLPITDNNLVDETAKESIEENTVVSEEINIDETTSTFVESTEEIIVEEVTVEDVVEVTYSLDQYQALENELVTLKKDYADLEIKYKLLKDEEEEKNKHLKSQLFEKFNAILGEDADSLKANSDKFDLEQLEEKLSAMAFKKGVNFTIESKQEGVITPKVFTSSNNDMPAWVKAVEKKSQSKNS